MVDAVPIRDLGSRVSAFSLFAACLLRWCLFAIRYSGHIPDCSDIALYDVQNFLHAGVCF